MLEVRKKETESNEALIRRFSRRVRQSRFLIQVKKSRYLEQEPNKQKLRTNALRRHRVRSEREYLRKIGKLEELQPGMGGPGAKHKRRHIS